MEPCETAPPTTGAMVIAKDCTDWLMPKIFPWKCLGARLEMRLLKRGQANPPIVTQSPTIGNTR